MKRRILFLLVCLVIGAAMASVVQADGYYYRWAPPPPTITCITADPGLIHVAGTGFHDEYNLPVGSSVGGYTYINGVLVDQGVFSLIGSASEIYDGSDTYSASYPLTLVYRYDTIIDGTVAYRSDLTIYCSGDGAGTATITNGVPNTGGSAIADGRINAENYAPVALYCDGSTLTAYAIDAAGQGTEAWSLDLSQAPSSSPLIDQNGVALTMSGDGRYSVLASQHDGKQYLFVFAGCPAPGATETYVSDPATGAFVRTH